MPHFSDKHCAYKVGTLCVLLLGFVGYALAFGMPTWERIVIDTDTDELVYAGLWQHSCYGIQLQGCQSYDVIMTSEPLFQSARSVACVSLTFYFFSAFLIILHNWTSYGRKVQTENKIVSFLSLLSGLCGSASCVIYGVCVLGTDTKSEGLLFRTGWGFVVGCVSSGFGTLGGILMIFGSYKDRQRVIKETEINRNVVNPPLQTSSTPPMALIAVPVSSLGSDFQTHIPMAVVAAGPEQPSSRVAQNYEVATSLQSSAPEVPEVPRTQPSAPPPDFHDMYY